jgi:uncharacterized coiled-coil protein SlyX
MPTTREVRLKNIERRLIALEQTLKEIKHTIATPLKQGDQTAALIQKVLNSK